MCGKIKFHSKAPVIKYRQESLNSCCLSSLASAFDSINQTKADNTILVRIEELLNSEVDNCINFANAILKNKRNI